VALVTTAVPLSTEQKAMILERLRARYGGQLQGQFEVDPSLLGGVQARVGDQLIDDSVAAKLEALREALMKSGEAK
jgi:F-type H+-transporting ATPase subunit delta